MKEYVDLGLPSGTLWCKENEEGYYTYDEAVEKFGGNLPTKEQFEELIKECKWRWDDENKGYKVVGKNDNSIFLSADGFYGFDGSENVRNKGSYGCYWTSTVNDSKSAYIFFFYFGNSMCMSKNYRTFGQSIRLVKNK